uniref:Secreted protein n=1 Tax=Brugia timori TaxID=42155 RepID=A0A0R3QC66_9BILA
MRLLTVTTICVCICMYVWVSVYVVCVYVCVSVCMCMCDSYDNDNDDDICQMSIIDISLFRSICFTSGKGLESGKSLKHSLQHILPFSIIMPFHFRPFSLHFYSLKHFETVK